MDSKNVVHKPNQTIMITNGEITPSQRKAYNVILQKAWNELRVDQNKTVFDFDLKDLKMKAGIDNKNHTRLKEDIRKLKNIEIEIIKENGDWAIFSLISQAEKSGNLLEIELPSKIRQALLDNNYYTTLDLLILKSLKGKYAIILYETAIRYSKKQIPEFTISELRNLTGTENKNSYDDFGVFRQKVLTPAITEINEKTDIELSYTPITRGKKIIAVKFDLIFKGHNFDEAPEESKQMEGQIDVKYYKMNQLVRLFFDETGVEFPMGQLSHLVEKKGYDFVLEYFIHANRFNYKKTPVGFFIKAISEEWNIPVQKRNPTKSNIPQHDNYEQRNYPKDYLDNFFNSKS